MSLSRLSALLRQLETAGLDTLALVPGPNLYYFTGLSFHLSERPIVLFLPRTGEPAIVLPELEAGKPALALYPIRPFPYGEADAARGEAFGRAAEALALAGKPVGVESRRMRVMELRHLEAVAPGATFPPAEAALAALRMVKDPDELAAMRRAAQIAEAALHATLPRIRYGMTERELAAALTAQLLAAGCDSEVPFAPIVASGPNSALPHAFPTGRKLQRGDLLILDWGAASGGYFSDITRTFALGEIDPEMRTVYELVQRANAAGVAAARPGAAPQEVDRAARRVIDEGDYGQHFIHRTGHGLGLEGHEEPYIREGETAPLAPGNTFTVEPGIYLPGRGGVRIEDDVAITADGAECLTTLPRDLSILNPEP
ncbi:MAG: aminopeptidase P family protein [Chloroflexi bacterium]|nr:aminopeptidase P family protein [Chloroflexota bacterium]